MNQATIEWLPTANGLWIGCTEEGKVVYKNDMLKAKWESDDSAEVSKAKTLIGAWAWAKKTWAATNAGDPLALGGQAEKDKALETYAAQVACSRDEATQAVNEAYGIS